MVNIERTNPDFQPGEMDDRFRLIKRISQDEQTDPHTKADLYFSRVRKGWELYNSSVKDESKRITIEQAFSLASAFYGEPEGFDLTIYLPASDDFGADER